LKSIAAAATVLSGIVSLFWPRRVVFLLTGLRSAGARGVTEIRAVQGGLFMGLGGAVLLSREPLAWRLLGLGYVGIASARTASMFADRTFDRTNVANLAAEVAAALILLL
jgi:hypothetical protein